MRKKLAGGALAVLGVLALSVGGTYAFFSSTVQGPSTVAQSGTLNLQLTTDQNVATQPIPFQSLVPGNSRSYYVQLTNTGTVAGTASWAFDNVKELENGCVAPEIAAVDPSCGPGTNQGELGNQLAVTFSLMGGPGCTGSVTVLGPETFHPSFSQNAWQPLAGVELDPHGGSRCVRVDVVFPHLPNNNLAQSDSSEFGFRFQLVS